MQFGRCKDYVRAEISALIESTKPKLAITLPGDSLTNVERTALKYGAKLICCEKDVWSYSKLIRDCSPKITLINELISKVIGNYKSDFIWLDFCSQFCTEVKSAVINLDMNNKSDVIITLLRQRDEFNNENERFNKICRFLSNHKVQPYKIYIYTDSSPMMVFFCKYQDKKFNQVIINYLE